MFLSNASIKRPVAMGCLLIALALLGLNAFRKMNLELLPQVDIPYITITTVYPGAMPEEIEIDVARRIEDAVASVDGLKHMTSYSMENMCQVLLEFDLEVDVDVAATDVREQIDLIRADLPADAEDPIILKLDLGAEPVITLALTGDHGVDELYDYADNQLRDRLSAILGVADVTLVGGAEREVQVLLDREALAARGLTSAQVVETVRSGVGTIPAGRVRESGSEYSVTFRSDFDRVEDLQNLEIINRDGHRLYLRDIGMAVMGKAEQRQAADLNGQEAIAINVIKRADANAVAMIRRVESTITEIQSDLPAGMQLTWVRDSRDIVEAMNDGAWLNVLQGVLLTGAILFFFLYNIRTLLVVAVSMPLTIIASMFFMHVLGFSLNATTLMAIGMSVGILVTNSIVVLEAIAKRLERSGDPVEAARSGAAEAFIPVLASAGTNMVVLFPLSIMGSLFGVMIRYFAMTLLILTVVSLFISFTLTPMLCALLLKPRSDAKHGVLSRMEQGWNHGLEALLLRYRRLLGFLAQNRWAALLVVSLIVAMLAHSMWLGGQLGTEGAADVDRGEILVKIDFPTHYSLDHTRERIALVQQRLDNLPHLRHRLTRIGNVQGEIVEGVHRASVLLCFDARTERRETVHDLMRAVNAHIEGVEDARATISIPGMSEQAGPDIALEIAGPSIEQLDALALEVEQIALSIPGILTPDTSVRPGKPELRIEPNRAVLADIGLSAMNLGGILRGNLVGIEAGTFKMAARNYDIIVKMDEREGTDQLQAFAFPGAPGRPLTLESIATVSETQIPVQIIRKNKQRIARITAGLSPELPMGTAVNLLSQEIDQRGILPPGYRYEFVGMYEIMSDAMTELGEAGLVALVLVFLMLAAILESFRQPFLILITIPITLIGIFWSLALTGNSMGIFVMMSAVMMMGIVVNNAILIMDQFNIHVADGMARHKAMITAASERFRPVVMITVAAVLGMLPMALSRAIGSEMRNAAGIASVGGILVSGILTLILLPVLYDLCTRKPKNGADLNDAALMPTNVNTESPSNSDDQKGETA